MPKLRIFATEAVPQRWAGTEKHREKMNHEDHEDEKITSREPNK